MSTAYIARGQRTPTSIRELTCPNGHSNAKMYWGKTDFPFQDMPCTFNHYGQFGTKIEKAKDISTAHDNWLYERYGFGSYTALGYCRICSAHFWWVTYVKEDKDQCRCLNCELRRLKNRQQPIDDAIFQVAPSESRRIMAGVPLFGKLNEKDQAKVDSLPDVPIIVQKLRIRPVHIGMRSLDDEIRQTSMKQVETVPF